VDVPVVGRDELLVLLGQQPGQEAGREPLARPHTGLWVLLGQPGALVQPLPEDAEPDLAGRHVLHQVEDVVVAKEVRRLEGGGLKALTEGVAVLQGDAQQVPRAADRPRGRLQLGQSVGIRPGIGQGGKLATQLVCRASLLPDRANDVDHLPVRHPFAAGPGLLLAPPSGDRALHPGRHPRGRAHRDVGLHAALPQGAATVLVGRVDGPTNAVLVGAHVGVGHGDCIDVGVDEFPVPRQRVRDAVDVVPPAGVEAYEVAAECGADLHQLEAGLELLHQDVGLDRAVLETELDLKRRQNVVPQGRLLGGLDLGQVEDDRGAGLPQPLVVVDHVEHYVDDGGRKALAVGHADVAIVQMQPPGAEDLGREV
jgi:hypothetical protein